MANKCVLAVDLGSATITAAVAGGEFDEPKILQPSRGEVWPAHIYVAENGTLVTDPAKATTVITRFARLLGREAQVIAGSPRHADSLVSAALAPIMASAQAAMKADVAVIAATYPTTWPKQVVAAYQNAVSRISGAEVMMVAWPDAIAAQTYPPDPYVDCPITSIDFGARSASVTMVSVTARERTKALYTITNPLGGFVDAARSLLHEIALERDGTSLDGCDEAWWDRSVTTIAEARMHPLNTDNGQLMNIDLTDPLPRVTIPYEQVTDFFVERLEGFDDYPGVLSELLDRSPVQQRWTIPGNPLAARPLVHITGGWAQDPAVRIAVQNVTGANPSVVDQPAHAAAWGAAKLAHETLSRLLPVGR